MNKLEISTYDLEGVKLAAKYGADRVELCANYQEGGTTPSYGLVKQAVKTGIDVFAIIRPRGGDFLYSDDEFKTIIEDMKIMKSLGVKGIVSGFLDEDGNIDLDKTKQVKELCSDIEFTFHRAFDMSNNWEKSLEELIEIGVDNILTSGQKSSAIKGADILKKIIDKSKNKIQILIAGGVNAQNVNELKSKTNCDFFHISGVKYTDSKMKYQNKDLSMGSSSENEFKTLVADEQKIFETVKALKKL